MSRALLTLESFLAISETMARAAEAQEWDELLRLNKERDALSPHLPSDISASLSAGEQNQGRTIIERCLQLDAQTQTLMAEQRYALGILLREPSSMT